MAQADSSSTSAALFWLFALLAGASALGVVISKNIVRMAVFLLGTLAGVAGLYFLLSAEFLAAVQLVVYAGGTLILIIFGVMLTSKSPFSRFAPKPGEVVIALGIGSVLMVSLIWGINRAVAAGVFGNEAFAADSYPMVALGQALLGDFLVPFEVASVLLLVVMIGAAYLAKARRREAEARGM
ncbi:MAG TPA: NADH-quinone oxidoreductase subunit J [Tepidisphaeraceae bacterium]|nr:NADH-quinone oxidoreductase subunit J [Tepidisphaeraceae bacterium]